LNPRLPRHDRRRFARGSRSRVEVEGGTDFHLAFSPSAKTPATRRAKLKSFRRSSAVIRRLVWKHEGALRSRHQNAGASFFLSRGRGDKILENIFRSVNIALVNELKVVYSAMDIDVWEVVNAAEDEAVWLHGIFIPGPDWAAIASD